MDSDIHTVESQLLIDMSHSEQEPAREHTNNESNTTQATMHKIPCKKCTQKLKNSPQI